MSKEWSVERLIGMVFLTTELFAPMLVARVTARVGYGPSGCGFNAPAVPATEIWEEEAELERLYSPAAHRTRHGHDIERQAAMDTAALLTATAYGLAAHCFVSTCDAGLGLFARSQLHSGQAIVEYWGPRLPIKQMKPHSAYTLEIPNTGVFIDGNYEHFAGGCPADRERSPAIYANHSRMPNCRLEHWPGTNGKKASLWLVANEPIVAGTELRFDYEEGGSNYWQGHPPRESDWRSRRIAPPPPSGVEPTIDYLPQWLEGMRPSWPR